MKFIRKPSPLFEAFQWFKLGDGPTGVVTDLRFRTTGICGQCDRKKNDHGLLPNHFRVCPGDWIAEIAPGKWKRFTPTAFEDFYIPVIDVENLVLEGLEKLEFSGLKAENPI